MDDQIIRFLQGRATIEEERELRSWRDRALDNERHFRRVEEVWALIGAADPIGDSTATPDARLIIARAEATTLAPVADSPEASGSISLAGAPKATHPTRRRRRRLAKFGSLAAGLAVVGFGIGLVVARGGAPDSMVLVREVATGAGELATVTLDDGTAIRVGPRSTLRLSADGTDRVAWLEGRAFFAVERDPSRTFIVRTEYGDATVLGTRFEVRSEEREFQVLVVQGSVRVNVAGSSVALGEGLLSRSVAGGPPSTAQVENVELYLDWMGSALVLRDTPVRRVLREIEYRYGIPVVLEDAALGDLTVTATFTDRPVDEVVVVLCTVIGAECAVEPELVRIGAPGSAGVGLEP